MPKIPQYTTTIIRERAVADTFDPNAIQRAGSGFAAASSLAGAASNFALQMQKADENTAVNEAIIAKQRENIDYIDQVKQERQSNPDKTAVAVEKDLKKRDEEIAETLPSRRAKKVFQTSAARINLQEYGNLVNWENTRKTEIYADRIQNAISDNNILMLRAGREGRPIDDYLKNVDATTVAATGVFAPEKLTQINQSGRAEGLSYYLQGVAERNPSEAKRILDSRKYDDDLGAAGMQSLYRVVDAEQKRLQAKVQADIKRDASAINDAARMGLSVDNDVVLSLAKQAQGADLESVASSLRSYAANQDKAREFAGMSVAQERETLDGIAKDIEGGNLSRIDEYDVLSNVLNNKQKMLSDGRGWEYYASHNIVHEPEQIDISNAESVAAALDVRRGDVQRIQDLEGFQIPILTANEIAGMKDMYSNGRTQEVSSMLSTLTASMTPDERRSLSQQLETTDAPILAAAMGQPIDVAEGIVAGSKLDNTVSWGTVMRPAIEENLSGYVYDSEAYVGASKAINSYYKHLSLLDGDNNTNVDKKRLRQAVEGVLGKPEEISVNGRASKVILFRDDSGDFVRGSHVENVLENMTLDAVRTATGGAYPVLSDGTPVLPEELNKMATFVTVGDGKYVAEFEGLGMIQSSKGGAFEFDIRAIEKGMSRKLTP